MEKKLELVARQQQKDGSATEWTAWAEAVRENIVQSVVHRTAVEEKLSKSIEVHHAQCMKRNA